MASLFEQYEQAAASSAGYMTRKSSIPEMTTTGYINAKLEDDTPIFNKIKIHFSPPDPISHFVACNNQLIIAMRYKILRMDGRHPDQPDEIDLFRNVIDKPGSSPKLYRLYLDPTGKYLLISSVSSETQGPLENLYLWHGSRKVYQAGKMKGHVISSVGWNVENVKENCSGCILVGTTKGLIYETELGPPDERNFIHYWKLVFDIGQGSDGEITGLEFHSMGGKDNKYFILATTPSRLYQFVGTIPSVVEPPVLQHIFNNYQDIPERFMELPGNLGYSKLQFYYPSPRANPQIFAWMTEPGVLCGILDYTGQAGEDSVTVNSNLLHYPEDKGGQKKPIGMVLTEFHCLVLFEDRLKIFCILNEQLVHEDVFTEMYRPMVGITKDPVKGTIWAFSDRAVFRYNIVQEDRNIWEVYLEKKEYELASNYCKTDPVKLDKVISSQAEDLFNKKEYEESAKLYALTHISFEEVALKFVQEKQEEALKMFLLKKLEGLKTQDKTQITMLVFWLMELFLNQISSLRNANKKESKQYEKVQSDFRNFLAQPRVKECVSTNKSAVYSLISNHGDEENLLFFTTLMNDYQRVIQYHLQHKNYTAALEILTKQSQAELFYQFSPALMQAIPRKTVNAWIEQNRRLNPARLIPALVQYDHTKDPEQGGEAIRYLEECVKKLKIQDQAIHNYLLALYARLQPDKLMDYLFDQGQEEETIPYDLKYALRLCTELGLDRACVHIYTTMGLYEEAVDLALKVDVELAKDNAEQPEDNEELRKKLWLKIAKHVVKEENDIKKAMEFLHKCDLIKIEDILPFFPDFVTIDHFKDAICASLHEYNEHIELLKEEMEQATQSAQEIRGEIQSVRNKYTLVKAQENCSICSYPVMTRGFYLFPCRHMFHSNCLIDEILPHLPRSKKMRVEEIQRQLDTMVGRDDTASLSSVTSPVTSTREKLSAELDDLVAAECLYCGEIMVKSIDEPFINSQDYSKMMQIYK